jgi:hypothetical protein
MEKYRRADITRLKKFLEDLKSLNPKRTYLVNMTKLTNLMYKVGFEGEKQPGSKRPFYHELLCDCPRYLSGRLLIAEAHGKKGMTYWDNFEEYVLDGIEHVLNRIETENLIIEENENV